MDRADWHAARAALGITREQAGITAASTGELWARRARYERELTWAPPHVGDDLRGALAGLWPGVEAERLAADRRRARRAQAACGD